MNWKAAKKKLKEALVHLLEDEPEQTAPLPSAPSAPFEAHEPVIEIVDETVEAARHANAEPEPELLVRACSDCAHFDLKAGQELMKSHAPFREVMQHIKPWQASVERNFVPNPEYEAAQTTLEDLFRQHGDGILDASHPHHSEFREVQDRIELLNPQIEQAPMEYVDADMLKLRWTDFGLCTEHSECRAKEDSCPRWRPRTKLKVVS